MPQATRAPCRRPALLAAAWAIAMCGACAAPRAFVRPVGTPAPVPNGARLFADAMTSCRAVHAYRADVGLSGLAGAQRVGAVRLHLAVDSQARIGLEALVLGGSVFRLGGDAQQATLLLTDDNRVVMAPAGAIVEALVGVRLEPRRLLALLSGCLGVSDEVSQVQRVGGYLVVTTASDTLYLRETASGWRPHAAVFDGLVAEYQRMDGASPRRITVVSESHRTPIVKLALDVRDFDLNPVFTGAEFAVKTPPGATPATLEQLRAAGPLGDTQ